jgi:hypothetical protein
LSLSSCRGPWKPPRKLQRSQRQNPFVQVEQRRFCSDQSWVRRQQETALSRLPWSEEPEYCQANSIFDPLEAESILSRLDPLVQYGLFSTLVNSSFLTSKQSVWKHKQALVAAADLRATYKAVDTTRFLTVSGQPYNLTSCTLLMNHTFQWLSTHRCNY